MTKVEIYDDLAEYFKPLFNKCLDQRLEKVGEPVIQFAFKLKERIDTVHEVAVTSVNALYHAAEGVKIMHRLKGV